MTAHCSPRGPGGARLRLRTCTTETQNLLATEARFTTGTTTVVVPNTLRALARTICFWVSGRPGFGSASGFRV